MGFYDYSVKDRQGNDVSMKNYEGKVVLVVNTATGCGFTPQYEDLEKIYEQYHDQGFEILDIPCNQFAGQTPGTDEEVHEFCTLKYNTKFDQMHKTNVNNRPDKDEKEEPLYTYLKSQQGFKGFGKGVKAMAMAAMLSKLDKNYKTNPDIKWNFTKFLIDRNGNVVDRFEPTNKMDDVAKAVASLI
jgi:glutathione peroxidase